jgi:hypothetical protein
MDETKPSRKTRKKPAFTLAPAAQAPGWLGEPKGSPVSKGIAGQWIRAAAEGYRAAAADQGRSAHSVGTYLLELHAHAAWRLYPDCAGFPDLVEKHVGMPLSTAYAQMTFAKVCTADQAALGMEKAQAGHVIVASLGLDHFDRLRDAKAMAARLGRPFDFEAMNAAAVSRVAIELTAQAALPEPAEEPKRAETAKARRLAASIEETTRRHPALAGLRVNARVYAGKAILRHRPAHTTDEMLALAALYRDAARR